LPDGRVMLTFLLQLRLRYEAAALASETFEAAVLGFPVVKVPLADTLTSGCFHRASIRFHG
jgi:hypothetical protein